MSDSAQNVSQTVTGEGNIFTGTGDVYVTQRPPPLSAADTDTLAGLRILLERVKSFWIDGVLEKSVHGAVLLDLGKQLQLEAIDHPWELVLELPDQTNQTLPSNTKILDIFDQRSRTLLILGEPGSGKTVTLLELARDLSARTETDGAISQAVPAVFNLSNWADKGLPLIDWLTAELSGKYGIPKRTGRSWLENNRILPLLDGLDEVRPEDRRAACVEAINTFSEAFGLSGLAVCSRIQDYTRLPVRLKLNGAIKLQPLTPEHVDSYLAAGGAKLKALRVTLQTDSTLQSLAGSPLMLSIMSLAYQDVPDEVLAGQAQGPLEERTGRLWDTYIARMFKRKGKGAASYSDEQTKGWLTWLAKGMNQHNQTVFLIEQLQPSWLGTRRQRLIYVLGSRLISGLSVGLILGIIFFGRRIDLIEGLYFGLIFGLSIGLIDALRFERSGKNLELKQASTLRRSAANVLGVMMMGGLIVVLIEGVRLELREVLNAVLIQATIVGLIFGLRRSRQTITDDIQTVESLSPSWRGALKGAAAGLIVGLFFVLIVVLIPGPFLGVRLDLREVLKDVLIFGPIFGVIGAMVGAFRRRIVDTKTYPNQGIRLSVRNGVFAGLGYGLSVGLVLALIPGQIVLGLILGLILGLLAGLWYGGLDVIQHFSLRFVLTILRYAPWNYSRFLDYAAERIFLRRVGGGYIFIHRLLMDHFAAEEA